mmetsp:Transcript_39773/g.78214  ORF Transcript_39773/g.78214 Transcript_39773/m.78214 type:complete len:314 (+) Transcript_39773:1-942(+)
MYSFGVVLSELLVGQRLTEPADVNKVAKQLTQQHAALLKKLLGRLDGRNAAVALLQDPMFKTPLRTCLVCGEDGSLASGVECDGKEPHFQCNDCFAGYVANESTDELRLLEKRDCKVLCPVHKTDPATCASQPFKDDVVARHVTGEVFQTYLKARKQLVEKQVSEEMTREHEQKMQAEFARLAKLDEKSRQVEQAYRHICEQILTNRCPRCHIAFHDIDDRHCFAMKCSNCPCNFCGWCLADCGTDAHSHVLRCKFSKEPGELFSTLAKFEAAHKERKTRLLLQYLAALPPEVKQDVIVRCHTVLLQHDLQIE